MFASRCGAPSTSTFEARATHNPSLFLFNWNKRNCREIIKLPQYYYYYYSTLFYQMTVQAVNDLNLLHRIICLINENVFFAKLATIWLSTSLKI